MQRHLPDARGSTASTTATLPRPSRNVTSLSGTFWGMSFHDWLPPTPQIRRGRLASLARTHTWSYSAPSHAGLFLYRTLTNRKQQKRRRANVSPIAKRGPDRPLHIGIGVSLSFWTASYSSALQRRRAFIRTVFICSSTSPDFIFAIVSLRRSTQLASILASRSARRRAVFSRWALS
jgi:hypothetical protein